MARPKNADAAATRGRILAAAASLFAQRGLHGTSTREIALKSGVSVATLHHHFGTKQALFDAASGSMWEGMSSVHKAFVHAIDDDDDLATLVDKCVRVAFAHVRDNQDSARVMMRQMISAEGLADGQHGPVIPFVRATATLVAAATQRSESRVRLELASVVYLIIRYGLMESAEVAALLDLELDAANDDALVEALENHLAEMSLRLLAIERDAEARDEEDA